MREKYYYLRDEESKPRITVCFVETEHGERARGVAMCCKKDNPSKKVGRGIAYNRALYALTNSKNGCVNRRRRYDFKSPFMIKAHYMPVMNEVEMALVDGVGMDVA